MDQDMNPENRKPMERVLYEVKKVIVGQIICWNDWLSRCWHADTSWSKVCRGWPRPWRSKTLARKPDRRRIQAHPVHKPENLVPGGT